MRIPLIKKIVRLLLKYEKRIYLFLGVFIFLLIVVDNFNIKKFFGFLLFVFFGGFFKYMIAKYRFMFEFTPIIFFSVIVAKTMGFLWVFPYLFLADMVASIKGGDMPGAASIPYLTWTVIVAGLSLALPIPGVGQYLILFLLLIGGLGIEQFIMGGLNGYGVSSLIGNIAINAYFFIKFSAFFVNLVS